MDKIRRFLGIFASLFIIAIAGNVHAAGYTCDTNKQYTACNPGYYPSECGTKRDGSTVTTAAGGSCLTCPTGYTCTGTDLKCPAPACIQITLNNTQNGGSGGTTTVYKKTGSTTLYSNNTCTTTTTLTKPTKTNATYGGHYTTTAATGGTQCITASGTWNSACNPTSATTYYAQYDCDTGWTNAGTRIAGTCTANCLTITLNNTQNGGSGGTTTVYKRTDSTALYSNSTCTTATTPTKPTKTNATYGGHYTTTAATGGTQCITASGTWSSSCTPTSNTTYYAQYDCNTGWTDAGTRIAGTCTATCNEIKWNASQNGGSGGQTTSLYKKQAVQHGIATAHVQQPQPLRLQSRQKLMLHLPDIIIQF